MHCPIDTSAGTPSWKKLNVRAADLGTQTNEFVQSKIGSFGSRTGAHFIPLTRPVLLNIQGIYEEISINRLAWRRVSIPFFLPVC